MFSTRVIYSFCFFLFITPLSGASDSNCADSTSYVLGTFSENPNHPQLQGEGIHILTFQNGKLTPVTLLNSSFTGPNPNYVVHDGDSLHTVNAVSDSRGGLTSVKFLPYPPFVMKTQNLLPHRHSNHVSLFTSQPPYYNKILLVSNMAGSSVSSYFLDVQGIPQFIDELVPPVAPNPRYGARIHGTTAVPGHDYALAMGFGADVIHNLHVCPRTGKLTLVDTLSLPYGDAPRHAVFHPPSGRAIVICENSRILTVVSVDHLTGMLKTEQRVNVLPDEIPNGGSSAIRMSEDHQFLYVAATMSSPMFGMIAAFKISQYGTLEERIGYVSSHGIHPHDFYLSEGVKVGGECNSYIVAPNMMSDNMVFMKRDRKTGMISSTPDFVYSIKAGASILQI